LSDAMSQSRREFLNTSGAVAGGAIALGTGVLGSGINTAYAQASDQIRVALVGCGGRGTGAMVNLFKTKGNVKLVAVADAFGAKTDKTLNRLRKEHDLKVQVPEEQIFSGLDAYKQAIDTECDLVVIATPPGFKPQQFEYAVSKGKHVFMEKPVAVDAIGVRRCLAAVEESKKKNLMVGIGLQRRHEERYKNEIKQIQDGVIGELTGIRVYWNGQGIWYRQPQEGWTQMQAQCNNWYHYTWLCGDQICEQHIHNLDVGCWAKGMYPVEANGMGGSERRLKGDGKESQIFDHTFVEYTFPDGTKMHSQGRHLSSSYSRVGEEAHGTKGSIVFGKGIFAGDKRIRSVGETGGHQQEQHDLVESLMRGEIYNEGEYGCKSTFTAILGREACYSGKLVKWDDLLAKGRDYAPGIDNYDLNTEPPAVKDADGSYDVPKPGIWDPYMAKAV